MVWIVIVFSFVLSAWLTWRFIHPTSFFYIADLPNERSLHALPTPRSGGIAILAAVVLGSVFQIWRSNGQQEFILAIGPALLVVAIISFLDDRHRLSAAPRIIAHTVSAGLLLIGGLSLPSSILPGVDWLIPGWSGVLASMLFVVWMINMYNFMDGMDGFAGGMAVSGFAVFAILGWMAGHDAFFIISLIVASASAGFLIFNFPPARIFMGDVGSSTLGLLVAAFSLWGARSGEIAPCPPHPDPCIFLFAVVVVVEL